MDRDKFNEAKKIIKSLDDVNNIIGNRMADIAFACTHASPGSSYISCIHVPDALNHKIMNLIFDYKLELEHKLEEI